MALPLPVEPARIKEMFFERSVTATHESTNAGVTSLARVLHIE
jgi:hypothetical protein